jgi:hypothetical protein
VSLLLLVLYACGYCVSPHPRGIPTDGESVWDINGGFVLFVSRHFHFAQVFELSTGASISSCSLGTEILDVVIAPDGQHIAWLDRKSIYWMSTSDCKMTSFAWSDLLPDFPPAPVRLQWVDSTVLLVQNTPPIVLDIHTPSAVRYVGQKDISTVVSMVSNTTDILLGLSDGQVLVMDYLTGATRTEQSFDERVVDVIWNKGEACALSLTRLKCGTSDWDIQSYNLQYPQMYSIHGKLWLQDKSKPDNGLEPSRWFEWVPSESKANEVLNPNPAWVTALGWITINHNHDLSRDADVLIEGHQSSDTLLPDKDRIRWQSGNTLLTLGEAGLKRKGIEPCQSVLSYQDESWCVTNEKVTAYDAEHTLYSKHPISLAFSTTGQMILAHPFNGITLISPDGVTEYSLSSRYKVQTIAISSSGTDIALGTTTGEVLVLGPNDFEERYRYPDEVVSLSWAGEDLMVAYEDEPFVVLKPSGVFRGDIVASAVAGSMNRQAVAGRYGGLILLHSPSNSCPKAVGVKKMEWIDSETLLWSGLTQGVWSSKTEKCRETVFTKTDLRWLDNRSTIESYSSLRAN